VSTLLKRVADGELRVVIDRTYPLSEASAAHSYIEGRQSFGRVLLIP
jgi:NADPH2:quinone reductase